MKNVEIWTFRTCPFCVKAKQLLDKLNVSYEEHCIPYGDKKLSELESKTGCGTLPQIFVNDEFIGDCSQLYALYEAGKLEEMLRS
jgi:glutaredoxin 3